MGRSPRRLTQLLLVEWEEWEEWVAWGEWEAWVGWCKHLLQSCIVFQVKCIYNLERGLLGSELSTLPVPRYQPLHDVKWWSNFIVLSHHSGLVNNVVPYL